MPLEKQPRDGHKRIRMAVEVDVSKGMDLDHAAYLVGHCLNVGYEETQDRDNLDGGDHPDEDCIELTGISIGDIEVEEGVVSAGRPVPSGIPGKGHAAPLKQVQLGLGISIKRPSLDSASESYADIYIERLEDRWTVNLTPAETGIKVVATIHDRENLDVKDHGNVIPPTP